MEKEISFALGGLSSRRARIWRLTVSLSSAGVEGDLEIMENIIDVIWQKYPYTVGLVRLLEKMRSISPSSLPVIRLDSPPHRSLS
jgi:hypothetical protein